MKKIIAFGGSTSSTSINKELAAYTASQVSNVEVEVLDMADYTAPLFSVDAEKDGFPEVMVELSETFKTADAFVVSLAEHNGSYAAAFKNTLDWLSRINRELFGKKPMILMATSPGGRGGVTVLGAAKTYFPYMSANIVADFSLPSFYDNFKDGELVNDELKKDLLEKVALLESNL